MPSVPLTLLSNLLLSPKASVGAQSAARPNTPEGQFGAGKDWWQGPCKEKRWVMLRRSELLKGIQGGSLYRYLKGGEGCKVCNLPLIGWWWGDRWCSKNLSHWHSGSSHRVLSLKLPSSTWVGLSGCYIPTRRSQQHTPRLCYGFFLHSLTLITVWIREGLGGWNLFPTNKKKAGEKREMWGAKKGPCIWGGAHRVLHSFNSSFSLIRLYLDGQRC